MTWRAKVTGSMDVCCAREENGSRMREMLKLSGVSSVLCSQSVLFQKHPLHSPLVERVPLVVLNNHENLGAGPISSARLAKEDLRGNAVGLMPGC